MGIMMIAGTERRRQGCSLQDGKQWGFTNNTGRPYITFPFKFSNVFTAISCICHNGSPSEANTVYNVSISGMNIGASGGGSGKYWCAFGVAQQQWGKILGDTVNLKIINFPVSFNECFGGLALFNGDPVAAAEYATITDITNTNFKIYMYANNAGTGYANANIFYLFLGAQQQWGVNIHGWVTFPITFVKFRRLVTNHQGNVFMDSKARESNTLSGFTLDVADNSDQNKDAQWIAIGA